MNQKLEGEGLGFLDPGQGAKYFSLYPGARDTVTGGAPLRILTRLELEPRPLGRAALATAALARAVALGSGGGRWLDPALMGYLFASVFACFGVAYRYFTWLERPATAMYWRWTAAALRSPRAGAAWPGCP